MRESLRWSIAEKATAFESEIGVINGMSEPRRGRQATSPGSRGRSGRSTSRQRPLSHAFGITDKAAIRRDAN